MQADGERLDQRAEPADGRIQRDRSVGGDADVFGESARRGAHPQQIDTRTVRGLVGQAPATRSARGQRQGCGLLSLPPLLATVGSDGDDLSAELVTQHHTGQQHRVHLQVRTANAAGVHAQHEFVGPGRRIGDVGNLESVAFGQDGGAHQCPSTSASSDKASRSLIAVADRSAMTVNIRSPRSVFCATNAPRTVMNGPWNNA